MIVYGLRLLVALLTFGVGVAAALLFVSAPTKLFVRDGVSTKTVLVASSPAQEDEPPPPMRSCPHSRPPIMGGILNGKAISKPQPVYPPAAKAAGLSGTVAVQIVVDEDGRVSVARAVSGPELLQDAAEDAAREARFSPTLLSGQPVKVSGVLTYNFLLE